MSLLDNILVAALALSTLLVVVLATMQPGPGRAASGVAFVERAQ